MITAKRYWRDLKDSFFEIPKDPLSIISFLMMVFVPIVVAAIAIQLTIEYWKYLLLVGVIWWCVDEYRSSQN